MTARIDACGLGVRFALDRHVRVLTPALERLRRPATEIWGLRGVDLEIGTGEAVALVGASGSGKTTMLRAIAGVLPADAGRLTVRGRVGALLDVDAGLLGPLTGRENAMLLGVLAGLSRSGARQRMSLIRSLSRLGDAFDRPVGAYSQGMRARLTVAVAVAAEPDVLLLDEVHEALDHEFRSVVAELAEGLLAGGGAVVAAGHDHDLLARLCPRAVLLGDGQVQADGPFSDVVGEESRGAGIAAR